MDENSQQSVSVDAESPEASDELEAEEPQRILSFDELINCTAVLDSVKSLGYQNPTEVQAIAIKPALEHRDLIIQAQTGSGKTLAFVVPMLSHLLAASAKRELNYTYALVVTPTRELAQQVSQVIASLSTDFVPTIVIGGVEADSQIKQLRKDPRIVVGTPGRLLDLMRQRVLSLKQCRYFVLDEADETLSMGFLEDVRAILSALPDRRQGLFVSATITPRVEVLAQSFLDRPKRAIVGQYASDMPQVKHSYCEVGGELMAKPAALCDIIEVLRPRSAIIFCNTKSDTQLVEVLLRRRGFDARRINSDLSQAQRDRVMKKIRSEELRFLVATDIAARGLDIEQIDYVINYAIHDQPEAYIHRTGRTGRAGRSGQAISLVGPRDIGAFHFLGKVLEVQFEKLPLPTDAEVADARLSHLFEMLRQKEIELGTRELLLAKELVKELGAVVEPTEELLTVVGKLCRDAIEHYIAQETKSLEEELEAETIGGADSPRSQQRDREDRGRQDSRHERSHSDRHRGDRDREGRGYGDRSSRGRSDRDSYNDQRQGQDRGDREARNDRGDRRDNDRGRDRGGDRNQNRDQNRDRRRDWDRDRRDSQDRNRDRRNGDNRRQDNRRQDDRRDNRSPRSGGRDYRNQPRRQDGDYQRRDEGPEVDEIRLYIGQGLAHGMTPVLFKELALEFAELQPESLRKLTIREHYGFVDLYKPQADILIQSVNGIEYNGGPLPVEYAVTLTQRTPRPVSKKREGGGEEESA